jgi:hypothetical protein
VREVEVALHPNEVPIIDARPAHGLFVDAKPERTDQVQNRRRRGAEAGNVSRVRRDFWLDQNHVKWGLDRLGSKAFGVVPGHFLAQGGA